MAMRLAVLHNDIFVGMAMQGLIAAIPFFSTQQRPVSPLTDQVTDYPPVGPAVPDASLSAAANATTATTLTATITEYVVKTVTNTALHAVETGTFKKAIIAASEGPIGLAIEGAYMAWLHYKANGTIQHLLLGLFIIAVSSWLTLSIHRRKVRRDIIASKEDVAQLKLNADASTSQIQDMTTNFEAMKTRLSSKTTEFASELKIKTTQLKTVTTKLDETTSQLEESTSQLEETSSQLDRATFKLYDATKQLEALEKQSAKSQDTDVQSVLRDLETTKSTNTRLTRLIMEKNETITKLEKSASPRDAQEEEKLRSLLIDHEELRLNHRGLVIEHAQLKAVCVNLRSKNSALQSGQQTLRSELEEKQDDHTEVLLKYEEEKKGLERGYAKAHLKHEEEKKRLEQSYAEAHLKHEEEKKSMEQSYAEAILKHEEEKKSMKQGYAEAHLKHKEEKKRLEQGSAEVQIKLKESLEMTLQSKQEEAGAVISELTKKNEELKLEMQNRIREHDQFRAKTFKEKASYKEEKESLELQNNAAFTHIAAQDKVLKDMERLKQYAIARDEEIEGLQKELSTANQKLEGLRTVQGTGTEKSEEKASLELQNKAAFTHIAAQDKVLKNMERLKQYAIARDEEIEGLQKELSTANQKLEGLHTVQGNGTEKSEDLLKKIESQAKTISECESKLEAMSTKGSADHHELQTLRTEIQNRTNELQQASIMVKSLENGVKQAETENSTLHHQISALNTQTGNLTTQFNEASMVIIQLRNEIQSTKNAKCDVEGKLLHQDAEVSKKDGEIAAFKMEYEATAQMIVARHTQELDSKKVELEKVKTESEQSISKLENDLKQAQQDLTTARKNIQYTNNQRIEEKKFLYNQVGELAAQLKNTPTAVNEREVKDLKRKLSDALINNRRGNQECTKLTATLRDRDQQIDKLLQDIHTMKTTKEAQEVAAARDSRQLAGLD